MRISSKGVLVWDTDCCDRQCNELCHLENVIVSGTSNTGQADGTPEIRVVAASRRECAGG